MLIIMENEEEIFRAWLKKYVKEDKKITGLEISKRLKVTPPTVTAWHSGRKNYKGEKYFPHIPFNAQEKIIEITGVNHDQIMIEGRKILSPNAESDIEQRLLEIEKRLESPACLITERHRKVIDGFIQKELALEINEELSALERLNPSQLKEILGIIRDRKFRIEQELAKKRTSNGED